MLLALVLGAGPAAGEVTATKEQALAAAFPEAEVDKEILYLSEDERQAIEQRARAAVDSRLFTVYRARRAGEPVGFAFIDTRTVRSKPATFLVVLSPAGQVRQVRILAWMEPPEYRPGERWLGQFAERGLSRQLRLGGSVQAMGGATLSSRTLTDGVRRALAVHAVKLAGEEE
jgi:Na+-translocating ferredoxin:NAD+ oxidoreductase RnfG subunit